MLTSTLLLRQLVEDLLWAKNSMDPYIRLYFTKESKIICLLNIVLLCGLPTKLQPQDIDELDCKVFFSLLHFKRWYMYI